MLDIHITEFYNDVGRIFNRLYSQFPRQITLWVDEISGPDQPDEYGMHSERYIATYATILWLQQEGLLRFNDVDKQDAFNHCCLTLDGFRLLSGIAELAQESERPIDLIRAALKAQSSNQMEIVVAYILSSHQKPS